MHRLTIPAIVAGAMFGWAGQASAEQFSVEDFSKTRICACDCLFQYSASVAVAQYESVRCEALFADGQRAPIKHNEYAGENQLIFLSPADISAFQCEGVPAVAVQ